MALLIQHRLRVVLAMLAVLLFSGTVSTANLISAPDFRAHRIDKPGEFVLTEHRGAPLLLEFWASWCGPCWRALDATEQLQSNWGPRGLQVVTVSVDEDPEKARDFAERRAPTLAVLADPQGEIADRYAVQGMPATFLIDCEGRIVARFEGNYLGSELRIAHAIAGLVAQGCTPGSKP